MRTYYDVLGLPFGASEREVKLRYRELAKQYHPDINPLPEAAARMREINEAYHVLSDPRRRLAYHLRLTAYALRKKQVKKRIVYASSSLETIQPSPLLIRLLAGLLMLVLLSAVGYYWQNPFLIKKARLAGYGFSEWPPYLSLPPTVESVDLSFNQLKEIPPVLWSLSHLRILSLAHNRITILPSEIYRWREIEVLSLAHNELQALPLGVGELSRLHTLDLSYNQLTDLPPELFLLPSLRYLSVRGNPLSPTTKESLIQWQKATQAEVVW